MSVNPGRFDADVMAFFGRVIKFRAWDKITKKMITPHDGDFIKWHSPSNWKDCYVVMQFTGLHDSKGKEIYEGDIVDFTYWWFDGNEAESHLTGTVVYLPGSMSFGLHGVKNADWIRHIGGQEGDSDTAAFATWLFDEADFEVIGNVFEPYRRIDAPQWSAAEWR